VVPAGLCKDSYCSLHCWFTCSVSDLQASAQEWGCCAAIVAEENGAFFYQEENGASVQGPSSIRTFLVFFFLSFREIWAAVQFGSSPAKYSGLVPPNLPAAAASNGRGPSGSLFIWAYISANPYTWAATCGSNVIGPINLGRSLQTKARFAFHLHEARKQQPPACYILFSQSHGPRRQRPTASKSVTPYPKKKKTKL